MASENSAPGRESWRNLFGNRGVAMAVLLGVLALHGAVNLVLFKAVELPPFYDGANHFNISADIKDHLDRFSPAYSWFNELYDISTYYPPCYHVLAALCMKVAGFTLDSARLPNLLFLAILAFSVFLLGERLFDTRTGLLAGILVSLFPAVHGLTREIYIDLALLAWAACAVYLLVVSDRFQKRGWSFLFGLVCGFGLLTKWTFPVFIGGPVVWFFCEAFLPVSLFRLAIGVLGSKEGGSEDSELGRTALSIGGWLAFAYGLVRLTGPGSLFLPWAVLSFGGVTALVVAQRTRRGVPPIGVIWERASRPVPPWHRCVQGILIACVPALLVAGPWYVKHFGFIAFEGSRVLTEAAHVRGMAEVGTPSSFLYYFLTLENHLLHLPFWIVAILGCASLVGRKGRRRPLWFLGTAFLVSYLVMSALWVKDPRYFMPAIYPLPILMAWWLRQRRQATRILWVTGVLAIGTVGYINQVVGLPLLSKQLEVPTPLGQPIRVAGPATYGNLIRYRGDWPHRKIVQAIQKDAATNRHLDGPLEVAVLVDDGFLHAPALNCYSRVLGAPIHFFNTAYYPDYRSDPGYNVRLMNLLRSPYFITKEGGLLGLDFVARVYSPLLKRLADKEEGWGDGAVEMASYPLPTTGTAILWSNDFPAAFLGRRKPIDRKLANGIRLEAFRRSRFHGFREGQPEVLMVEWVPEPRDKLGEILWGYRFFLHLEDAVDGRFIQSWNVLLTNEGQEVAEFQLGSASPPAVVTTILLEPRDDLIPGRYQFRLGAFDIRSMDQVGVIDPIEEIKTSVALGEPFLFEPEGWQYAHAAFEDREALKVRGQIGSLALESARFEPRTARPGQDLALDAHWSVRWLELEAPEEQDIRGFAYLLPAGPQSEAKPVAYTEWTLDALGHSGSEVGYWSTTARLALPSDMQEGEWRLHIGIRRPQYDRSFVIRNGPQADRRTFGLEAPLLVGYPDWHSIGAEYPNGLRLEAARVRDTTPVVGADLGFDISWSAKSATSLVEAATSAFLFAHLFSLDDGAYAQVETFPLFRRDRIHLDNPAVAGRDDRSFFEAIRAGFSENLTVPLRETLAPGRYRLDFGLYLPAEDRKEAATFPTGSTTTTVHLPGEVMLRLAK